MMANVLGITLEIPKAEEGPGYGGAMLAMVGCGEFGSVDACAESLLSITSKVEPDHETAARYEEKYRIFCKLYPALKGVFQELNR
jgi:xylulokinase